MLQIGKGAINSEFNSIQDNNTWVLTNLPPCSKAIICKWIFKRKLKHGGSINKYKVRLVEEGYSQCKGVDYNDTHARITAMRTIITLASVHNLIIHQMNVKTAFLNDDLDKEIYMEQPIGS